MKNIKKIYIYNIFIILSQQKLLVVTDSNLNLLLKLFFCYTNNSL